MKTGMIDDALELLPSGQVRSRMDTPTLGSRCWAGDWLKAAIIYDDMAFAANTGTILRRVGGFGNFGHRKTSGQQEARHE
jgi:hypothetical protein